MVLTHSTSQWPLINFYTSQVEHPFPLFGQDIDIIIIPDQSTIVPSFLPKKSSK